MPLNKVKKGSNMYQFCNATWNAIKGKCPHDCSYCYMKRFPQGELRFDEKELKTDLGEENFIFVGSSCDMFADEISKDWIFKILEHCNKYPKNKYLFQTKNPKRFHYFLHWLPKDLILGITMETNDMTDYEKYSKAPLPSWRISEFDKLPEEIEKMITIEPIMDFNVMTFHLWLEKCKPEFVNIGADSKGHNLPEPSWENVQRLIKELEKFTKVNLKDNLKRLKKNETKR